MESFEKNTMALFFPVHQHEERSRSERWPRDHYFPRGNAVVLSVCLSARSLLRSADEENPVAEFQQQPMTSLGGSGSRDRAHAALGARSRSRSDSVQCSVGPRSPCGSHAAPKTSPPKTKTMTTPSGSSDRWCSTAAAKRNSRCDLPFSCSPTFLFSGARKCQKCHAGNKMSRVKLFLCLL